MNEDTRQELAALQELAQPFRFKVGIVDGEAAIFGRKGDVEWHQFDNKRFAAYTNSSKTITTLLKLPWITVHQRGDRELRALFPREKFSEVAAFLKLRRKRPAPKPETIQKGLRALEAQRQPTVHTRISVQMTLFGGLPMEKVGMKEIRSENLQNRL